MNTFKQHTGSLKIPLLIISMIVIFSFGFHSVNAADTSHIYINPSGNDAWNGQSITHTSSNVGPKKTIQSGVSTISSGGVLRIASGTYNTNNIVISKSMTILGAGQSKTVINGNYKGVIMKINSNAKVTISGVTFYKGKASYGGAIHNSGTLTVTASKFLSNNSPNYGGAIFNGGYLKAVLLTFSGNYALSGAGIANDEGSSMGLTYSNFTSNHATGTGSGMGYGGAIMNIGTAAIAVNNFIANTGFEGAGIFNCGNLVAKYSNFKSNVAQSTAGALDTYHGATTLYKCVFNYNHSKIFGGALYVDTDEGIKDTVLSYLKIQYCSFTSNTASKDGGAIHSYHGMVTVTGSKFISNISGRYGGAISNYYGILNQASNVFSSNVSKLGVTINQWK
jgi:hypothetical protein